MIHVWVYCAWWFTSISIFSVTFWELRWADCVLLIYNIECVSCFWLIFSRKRLKGTCDYIYQTLFLDGEGNDVTIEALG